MAEFSGYLAHRGRRTGLGWTRRFFVLTPTSLTYSESATKVAPRGRLLVDGATVARPVADDGRPHCFEVATRWETMRLAAASSSEAAAWVEEVAAAAAAHEAVGIAGWAAVRLPGLVGETWARRFVVARRVVAHYADTRGPSVLLLKRDLGERGS